VRAAVVVLEAVATLLLATRMVISGFFTPSPFGGILSWPMFCHFSASFVSVEVLEAGTWKPINVFDLLPSGVFILPSKELQDIVDYLKRHYDDVRGEGTILYRDGEFPLRIVDGLVEVSDEPVGR
jgi:hypothetical protein